jgi:hypothetical protein
MKKTMVNNEDSYGRNTGNTSIIIFTILENTSIVNITILVIPVLLHCTILEIPVALFTKIE